MILTHENKDNLLYAYFSETLSEKDFISLPAEFDSIDNEHPIILNRLISLCNVKDFNLNYSAILYLSEKRNKKVYPNSFKTALLVGNNIQLGFARMFQTFIDNPQMTIEIFTDEIKAVEWLKSDAKSPAKK
jgi:hypothetical protein